MGLTSRILAGLSIFLLVAAGVYWFTAYEEAGGTFLLVAGLTFGFLALVARSIAKREAASGEAEAEAEPEVLPTIWPLVFSLSAILLMLGVIATPWLAAAGAVVFILAAAGWARDVTRARSHTEG